MGIEATAIFIHALGCESDPGTLGLNPSRLEWLQVGSEVVRFLAPTFTAAVPGSRENSHQQASRPQVNDGQQFVSAWRMSSGPSGHAGLRETRDFEL